MILNVNNPNPWNSLEVIKLVISGLTPIIIAFIGLYLNRILKKFEHRQWRNQKLIEKRLLIYEELAPLLNDLLCYFTYIGSWKESTPDEIVQKKRIIDKKVYIAAPLFTNYFFIEIQAFIKLCYKTYQGWGQNAKLLTDNSRRKEVFGKKWDKNWDTLFIENSNEITARRKLKESYFRIMKVFSDNIGLNENGTTVKSSIKKNIKN